MISMWWWWWCSCSNTNNTSTSAACVNTTTTSEKKTVAVNNMPLAAILRTLGNGKAETATTIRAAIVVEGYPNKDRKHPAAAAMLVHMPPRVPQFLENTATISQKNHLSHLLLLIAYRTGNALDDFSTLYN